MDVVRARKDPSRLFAHEWLEKDGAMRLGIELGNGVVPVTNYGVLASRELVQLGILQVEVALSHGAFYVSDGMAHHATESGLGFGRVHNLLDGRVHLAGVEYGGIVGSVAPPRR